MSERPSTPATVEEPLSINRDVRQADLDEVQQRLVLLRSEFEALLQLGLHLDMTRGKPCPEQLDLALPMMEKTFHYGAESGEDGRNYGNLQGLLECRQLMAPLLGASPDHVVIGDNSSLAMMHDSLVWALMHGVPGSANRWKAGADKPAFLCPVPGYDRHFQICDSLGIDMIPVPLTGEGPDVDQVERLVGHPRVKGIWCVPLYSNPTGEVYSGRVARRLASMPTAASDFRIFWDNAYAVHHLTEKRRSAPNVIEACSRAGFPDRPFVFTSLSKVTFAGSAIAAFASSSANVDWWLKHAGARTIGPDKLNQLRHVAFLIDEAGIHAHMRLHRRVIRPKFEALLEALAKRLKGRGIARWSDPQGGYFVSVDVLDGTARRVVELARILGIQLTSAGSTWPGGVDPYNRTLRLAPTFPPLKDVERAAHAIALCIELAALESQINPSVETQENEK